MSWSCLSLSLSSDLNLSSDSRLALIEASISSSIASISCSSGSFSSDSRFDDGFDAASGEASPLGGYGRGPSPSHGLGCRGDVSDWTVEVTSHPLSATSAREGLLPEATPLPCRGSEVGDVVVWALPFGGEGELPMESEVKLRGGQLAGCSMSRRAMIKSLFKALRDREGAGWGQVRAGGGRGKRGSSAKRVRTQANERDVSSGVDTCAEEKRCGRQAKTGVDEGETRRGGETRGGGEDFWRKNSTRWDGQLYHRRCARCGECQGFEST
jgi:hypothetical protein